MDTVTLTRSEDADRTLIQSSAKVSVMRTASPQINVLLTKPDHSKTSPSVITPLSKPNNHKDIKTSQIKAQLLLKKNVNPHNVIMDDEVLTSLMKLSDDKLKKLNPGLDKISATVAEMQARINEITYKANLKITLLSLVIKRLNSAILLQFKLTQDTLSYIKEDHHLLT